VRRSILIHLGISQFYFWLIILLSWNKSGGDIFAVFFVAVFLLVHLLVVVIKMLRQRQHRHYMALLGVACGLALHVLSFYLLTEYREYKHEAAGGDRMLMD
jgi:uncharacterized protein involved in response to NO